MPLVVINNETETPATDRIVARKLGVSIETIDKKGLLNIAKVKGVRGDVTPEQVQDMRNLIDCLSEARPKTSRLQKLVGVVAAIATHLLNRKK